MIHLLNLFFSKKIQCDRRYPCDHCTKRRRPDECVYHAYPNNQDAAQPLAQQSNVPNAEGRLEDQIFSSTSSGQSDISLSLPSRDLLPLTQSYGYLESSDSNTLALVRKVRHLLALMTKVLVLC